MMKANQNPLRRISSRAIIVLCLGLIVSAGVSRAASWSGIEPLRSRRADVERALGAPVNEQPDNAGALVFRVAGGTVTVSFADARFIQ